MTECPYCRRGFEEGIEMNVIELDLETDKRRYMCPECRYDVWE